MGVGISLDTRSCVRMRFLHKKGAHERSLRLLFVGNCTIFCNLTVGAVDDVWSRIVVPSINFLNGIPLCYRPLKSNIHKRTAMPKCILINFCPNIGYVSFDNRIKVEYSFLHYEYILFFFFITEEFGERNLRLWDTQQGHNSPKWHFQTSWHR